MTVSARQKLPGPDKLMFAHWKVSQSVFLDFRLSLEPVEQFADVKREGPQVKDKEGAQSAS